MPPVEGKISRQVDRRLRRINRARYQTLFGALFDMMVYVSCLLVLVEAVSGQFFWIPCWWIDRDMEMTSREKVGAWWRAVLLTLSVFSFVEGLLEK